jgi:hypothetical protein
MSDEIKKHNCIAEIIKAAQAIKTIGIKAEPGSIKFYGLDMITPEQILADLETYKINYQHLPSTMLEQITAYICRLLTSGTKLIQPDQLRPDNKEE